MMNKTHFKESKILHIFLPLLVCAILAGCSASGGSSGKDKREYTPGERTETSYSSEWIGLRYELNSNMVMATDEELNSMMDLGAEALDVDSSKVEYAKLTTVYEMMAVDVATQSSIVVCAEKLVLSGTTEEQYVASVRQQTEEMYSGYSVTYGEDTQRDLAGLTFSEMSYVVDYGSVQLHQTYLVKKQDDRMYGIVLSYTDEAMLDTLLEGFSAY